MSISRSLSAKQVCKFFYRLGGASLLSCIVALIGIPRYLKNLFLYALLKHDARFSLKIKNLYPRLGDATSSTKFDRHYIYHVHWALKLLSEIKPSLHVDFSSSLNFISALAVNTKTLFYDFRPADLYLENLKCAEADLMDLSKFYGLYDSVSCMHVIEHIGLGRYGDKVSPIGDVEAINQLKRVVRRKGNLFIVVPVGYQCLYFDAHRVYDPNYFASLFLDEFKLLEFSYISNKKNGTGIIKSNKVITVEEEYGCGCFWFKKID